MSLLEALILAIVQGLTEFLPVSSTGHLLLVPFIAGWKEPTLAFIVAVHLGTIVSLVWVFRQRLVELVLALFGRGTQEDRRLVILLAIASVPAALVGAIFSSQINSTFERPVANAFMLGITAWILFSAESAYENRKEPHRADETLTPADAGLMGVAQAVSILPGISRSGATIAAGMWRGISRESAARFSFLMAVPIILGAVAVQIPDMAREGAAGSGGAIVLGIIVSAIVGVLAIRAMLGVVARRGYRPFAVYCVFACIAGLLTALARG